MTPLAHKLGLRPGRTGFAMGGVVDGLDRSSPAGADILLAFVVAAADIPAAMQALLPHYRRGGWLWFAYPKQSGAMATDLNRDAGWQPLVDAGLLPVSQVAINSDWSALRFRYRDEIRRLTRAKPIPGMG